MSVSRFADHLQDGIHADRPAAADVAVGTLYGCSTHSLVYQSDGTTWSTWFDPSATGGALIQNLVDAAGDLLVGSADNTLVRLAKGSDGTFFGVSGGAVGYWPVTVDPEVVRDTIAAALVAGDNVDIDVDDAANTITVNALGAPNVLFEDSGAYPTRPDAGQVALFVGVIDPGPDGLDVMETGDVWLNGAGDDSDLDAIAALSTTSYGRALLELADQAALVALLPDATTTVRGIVELATNAETATGTDAVRAVTPAGLASVLGGVGGITLEDVRDMLATALVAGTNMTITPNDGSDTITFAASGGGALHGAKVYRATTFSLASGASTTLVWDAEEYDTDAFHDNSTNASRFTVPTGLGGYYRVTVSVATDAIGSTGRVLTSVLKNGTLIRGGAQEFTANQYPSTNLSVDVALAAGDYVTASHFQDSAGAKNLYLAQSAMSIYKLG